jgi:hypothetical protein
LAVPGHQNNGDIVGTFDKAIDRRRDAVKARLVDTVLLARLAFDDGAAARLGQKMGIAPDLLKRALEDNPTVRDLSAHRIPSDYWGSQAGGWQPPTAKS